MSGKGEAWFDDFSLKIDGQDVQVLGEKDKLVAKANLDHEFDMGSRVQFPELDEFQLASLQLLGKIWGFLKYHHPQVGKGNYNWDYELFRILPNYLGANTIVKRNQILTEWIDKYGKLTQCKTCEKTSPDAFLKPDLLWIENSGLDSKLENKLNEIYQNRFQGEHFYIGSIPNIGNPKFKNESPYYNMPYPDVGFRLLALFKYWNAVQYFFPYKSLIDKNWDGVLKEYIPIFINGKSELEYELTVLKLIGDINDTHAAIGLGNQKINAKRGDYYPPFQVRFIEDKLVVTDYHKPALKEISGLEIGDIITHIQGHTIQRIVDSLSAYYPASNNASKMRDISSDLLRSNTNNTAIQYISDNQKKRKSIKLYKKERLDMVRWDLSDRKTSYKFLQNDIGYITLRSLEKTEIDTVKQLFKNTKGIVIDIRNYPNTPVPYSLGSYFMSSKRPFVRIMSANPNNPGEFNFVKLLKIPKGRDTYQGKLVVLVNEYSQSQSEFTAMAFRAGDSTVIIGSTTAGADGNVSSLNLPGGMTTRFSGNGIFYPDGTETQRIGIVPDIVVKPTIMGIVNGEDEVLDKAIALINEKF